jgi:hypothetical protein
MTTPNKVNLMKWIAALRSGEFTQSRMALREQVRRGTDDMRYCCLGVACEIYRRETGDGEWHGQGFAVTDNVVRAYLPLVVAEWLGTDTNPKLLGDKATKWNDTLNQSFGVIADAIEKEFNLTEEPSHA